VPVPGRKPKPDGQKRNRNAPTHEWRAVPNVAYAGKVPGLPRDIGWPSSTRRWWRAISRMPHCVLWEPSDWQFALDTALVAKAFHEGDTGRATELRQREKILGVTLDARRDLRIRYIDPAAPPADEETGTAGSVTALHDYRAMLEDE
jgi:hypothetical protein